MESSYEQFLVPAFAVFLTGLLGALSRKNIIVVFMCVELMLCAAMLTFVAFAASAGDITGAAFVFFIMAIAAAEVAVGLAIIVKLFALKHTVSLDKLSSLGD